MPVAAIASTATITERIERSRHARPGVLGVNQRVDEAQDPGRQQHEKVNDWPPSAAGRRGADSMSAQSSAKPPNTRPPTISQEAKFFHCTS